jgi:hypothetical protein
VGGASSSAPSSSVGGGVLPFTGAAGTLPLLAAGLALVGLGVAALLARAHRGRA